MRRLRCPKESVGRAGMAGVTCGRWREFTGLLRDSAPAPVGDPRDLQVHRLFVQGHPSAGVASAVPRGRREIPSMSPL